MKATVQVQVQMGTAVHPDPVIFPTGPSSHRIEAPLEDKALDEVLAPVLVVITDLVHPIKRKKGGMGLFRETNRFLEWL